MLRMLRSEKSPQSRHSTVMGKRQEMDQLRLQSLTAGKSNLSVSGPPTDSSLTSSRGPLAVVSKGVKKATCRTCCNCTGKAVHFMPEETLFKSHKVE